VPGWLEPLKAAARSWRRASDCVLPVTLMGRLGPLKALTAW
jgi:hypothetical protein